MLGQQLSGRAGYATESDRDDWRRFGWNWGIVGALGYWAARRLAPRRNADPYFVPPGVDWAFRPATIGLVILMCCATQAIRPFNLLVLFAIDLVLTFVVGVDNDLLGRGQATALLTFLFGLLGYLLHAYLRLRVRRAVSGGGVSEGYVYGSRNVDGHSGHAVGREGSLGAD